MLQRLLEKFLNWVYGGRGRVLSIALALVAVIGGVDYVTGYEWSLTLFYLFPVLLATQGLGQRAGLAIAVLAAGVWTLVQWTAVPIYFTKLQLFWNVVMRFGVLALVAYLLLKLETETRRAHHDELTRLGNRRQFMEWLEAEQYRSARLDQPFSLLYLDIDRFKTLNDTQGHAAGDTALRKMASTLRAQCRRIDKLARIGGDEFVVLLPEANELDCRTVAARIQQAMAHEISKQQWPIGVSIGMTTARGTEKTAEELLCDADRAMYHVKHATMNGSKPGAAHAKVPERPQPATGG